ncbi:MAG: site-specific integrase, partial [Bacteroidales bacterium]|nr:site-specific integrase [Bacteroidales bacterium]
MANTNETVHLRKRQRTHGGYSLYLDIYANGRRNYEYLKLYLVPETTRADKTK